MFCTYFVITPLGFDTGETTNPSVIIAPALFELNGLKTENIIFCISYLNYIQKSCMAMNQGQIFVVKI